MKNNAFLVWVVIIVTQNIDEFTFAARFEKEELVVIARSMQGGELIGVIETFDVHPSVRVRVDLLCLVVPHLC